MFSEMFDVREGADRAPRRSEESRRAPSGDARSQPPPQQFDIGPGFIPSKLYSSSMPMNAAALFSSRTGGGVPNGVRPPSSEGAASPTTAPPYERRMPSPDEHIVAASPPAPSHMDRRSSNADDERHHRAAAAFPGTLGASPSAAHQLHLLQQAQHSHELARYADLRVLMPAHSSSSRAYDLANTPHGGSHPPQPGMMLADSMSYHHAQPLGMPPPARAYDAPVVSPRPSSPPKSMKKNEIASRLSALSHLSSQEAQALAVAARHRAEAERIVKHQSVMSPHASMVTHGAVIDAHHHGPPPPSHAHVGLPKHQNFDPATHFGMSHGGIGGAGGVNGAKRRVKRKKTTIACNHCYKAKAGCDLGRPCIRCIRLGKEGCVDRDPIPKSANNRSRKARKKSQQSSATDSESKDCSKDDTKDADSSSGSSSTSSSSSSKDLAKSGSFAALFSVSNHVKSVLGTDSIPLDRISHLASFKADDSPPGVKIKTEPNDDILIRTKEIMASLPAKYAESELIAKTIAAFHSIVGSIELSPRQAQWLSSMAAFATPMDDDTQRTLRKSFLEVAKSDAEPIDIEQTFTTDSEENLRLLPMVLKDDPHFTCPDVLGFMPASVTRSVMQFSDDGRRCRSVLEFNQRTCDLLGMSVEEVQDLLRAGFSKTYHHDDWIRFLKGEVARIVKPRTGPTDHETTTVCRVFAKNGEAIPCIQITRARHNVEGLPMAKLIITIPIPR